MRILTTLMLTLVPVACASGAVESLGQPCRARQILGTAIVTDRQDGRERLILLNDNETYHCEILYIDFEKNAGEVFAGPAGAGSWCGIEVPGDKFIVGTFYDGTFMIFDLRSKTFSESVKFPSESYIWNLAIGTDGRVYGGTYPGGKLGALDVEKGTCEVIGTPTPKNQYLRYVSATPWGDIFCDLGMVESTTKVYSVRDKTWRDIPGLPPKAQFGVGVAWNGHFVVNHPVTGKVEAFRDATLTPVKELPFPTPGGDFKLDATLSNARTIYLTKSPTLFRYAAGDPRNQLEKVTEVQVPGGRFVAVGKDGTLLGVRGQAYYVVRPGETEAKLRQIPVEGKGRPSLFLRADGQGRVWGGPHFGQTLFYHDIKSGKATNTDVICDAGGEVYDVAFHKGIVYAASYSGGDISAYDPAAPWDQLNHKNPRPLAKVAPQYIRPEAGIEIGPDGKLYAGWVAKYGVYGGAVSITDPSSGKTDLIENPLGEQGISSLGVDAKHVYVGTTLAGNGLPEQKAQAKFGVIELASRKVVFEKAYAVASISRLVVEPKTGMVFFAVGSTLHRYDPMSGDITDKPVPDLKPAETSITARDLFAPGDGTLITACQARIIRIDTVRKTVATVAIAPAKVDSIALADDGRLYFDSGPDLYRTEPLASP